MTPEEVQQMIPDYLAGRLDAAQTRTFKEHLTGNAELLMQVEELRATWQNLGLIPAVQPSAALRARFYRRVHDIQSGRVPVPRGVFLWPKVTFPSFIWQATMVLVLFCLGIYAGRLTMNRPASASDPKQLQEQVQTLRQSLALSLLDRQSASARLEGASFGGQVDHPDRDLLSALVTTLQHDPNTNVRLAALDALENFSSQPPVRQAMINALGEQDSPLVQIALIDALVHIREPQAAREFRKLSTEADANAAVRQRAQWALHTLSF